MNLPGRLAGTLPAILWLVALTGCAGAPTKPENLARGDYEGVRTYVASLIRHEMAKDHVVGLSIAVVDDQRVLWAEGFGYADQEEKVPADARTLYRVGSISKLFTTTAALQLAERHELDIDRPLNDVLPEFSMPTRFVDSPPITPRRLMSHHSGLPRDIAKGMFTRNPVPLSELPRLIKDADLAYPPDHVFFYSNVGISLLGYAIERAVGQPFEEYMRQSVLEPLQMRDSSFSGQPLSSAKMSKAYKMGNPVDELPLRDIPAGGLNASVADLSRFLSMIFAAGRAGDRQVLQPRSVTEMLRPQNKGVPLDLNFYNGLGWMLSTLGGRSIENAGTIAHHAGATMQFRAQMYAAPDHKIGVVVLANSGSASRVVDRVAAEALALALEAKSGVKQVTPIMPGVADVAWPAEQLQPYVGDYSTIAGHLRIVLEGGQLRAETLGRTFQLVPHRDGQLRLTYRLLGWLPVGLDVLGDIGFTRRNIDGHDVLVARLREQEMLLGERIPPATHLEQWRPRLGRYAISNAGEDYTFVDSIALIEADGSLFAELVLSDQAGPPVRIALRPISDSEALLLGVLADGGAVLRCRPAARDGSCLFSGYTLQKLAD